MNRAYGVDLHPHYQHDFERTDEDFAIVKVSQANWQVQADKERGLLGYEEYAARFDFPVLGAYHYIKSGVSVNDQVSTFMNAQEKIGADFLAIDYEKYNNVMTVHFAEHLKFMVDQVRELSGKQVLVYSSPAVLQEHLLQYDKVWLRDNPAEYPLWAAQWPYTKDNWQGDYMDVVTKPETWQPWLPAGHTSWKFWQFYVSDNLDRDVFNGTLEDLQAWAAMDEGSKPDKPCRAEVEDVYQRVIGMIQGDYERWEHSE